MSLVFQTDMIKAIVTEKMTEPVVKRKLQCIRCFNE